MSKADFKIASLTEERNELQHLTKNSKAAMREQAESLGNLHVQKQQDALEEQRADYEFEMRKLEKQIKAEKLKTQEEAAKGHKEATLLRNQMADVQHEVIRSMRCDVQYEVTRSMRCDVQYELMCGTR